ncbi:FAS1-like dehydratase domain-containing protein [Propionibacteriaceae bacterium Y1685]
MPDHDATVPRGLSPAVAGRTYPPTSPYTVSAAKVDEFALVLGHDTGQEVAPPTFAIVLAARAWESMFADAELGLALERIVHGDQKFTFTRPLRVGDEVTATLTIDRVLQRAGTDMITSSVAITTTDGEPVGTATATFVHTPPPNLEGVDQ